MSTQFDRELEERLVRYVQIDTPSDDSSPSSPSTDLQLDLQRLLVDELKELGAADIVLTDYGTVIATVPSTVDREVPTVALLAHVDTTQQFNGIGVRPVVHRNYDGGDIRFADDESLNLTPLESAYLGDKVGHDIVTASGTTLLGADDKAGVAIIMTLAQFLLASTDIEHGPIRVCFTPDEEIGRGVHPDLPKDLGADVGYTLDGGEVGEIVYETFSADRADVTIKGVASHPGDAKDVLVNALHLAAKIIDSLPHVTRTPETTEGRQGFIHLVSMNGGSAEVDLYFILRDFERDGLADMGSILTTVCQAIQAGEPRAQISCEITPQYRNMRYWLEDDMRPVELAREAARSLGVEPTSAPTRGGTDGSRLTEMGLPTPNLFTGMQNIHGPLEWISVQDMALATEHCLQLAKLWATTSND